MSRHDITGMKFGRLTAISFEGHYVTPKQQKYQTWKFRCECGNEIVCLKTNVTSLHTTSCGCLRIERLREALTTHGLCPAIGRSPIFDAYHHAKARCENPKDKRFNRYGARGIKFLFNDFEHFISEMESSWKPGLSLDRKNNDGHYEPGNCKWSSDVEQSRNRSSNRLLTLNGVMLPAVAWAEKLGWSPAVIYNRVRYGWSEQEILTTPVRSY